MRGRPAETRLRVRKYADPGIHLVQRLRHDHVELESVGPLPPGGHPHAHDADPPRLAPLQFGGTWERRLRLQPEPGYLRLLSLESALGLLATVHGRHPGLR